MFPDNKCLTSENFKENKHSFELKLTWDENGSNICNGEGGIRTPLQLQHTWPSQSYVGFAAAIKMKET